MNCHRKQLTLLQSHHQLAQHLDDKLSLMDARLHRNLIICLKEMELQLLQPGKVKEGVSNVTIVGQWL